MPRVAQHGFQRVPYAIASAVTPLTGTSATVIQGAKALGFRYRIEAAFISAQTALVGGTRTVQVKRGTTVLFSLAIGNSNLGTIGNVVDMTAAVAADQREFGDADTLLVDVASGGTSVTAGAIVITLVLRELPQAAS
jgi:hypothetical protein